MTTFFFFQMQRVFLTRYGKKVASLLLIFIYMVYKFLTLNAFLSVGRGGKLTFLIWALSRSGNETIYTIRAD